MKTYLRIPASTIVIMTILFTNLFIINAAPNSGDGVSDGSGWSGDWFNFDKPGETSGPAPNSGDGISDGSGW